MATGDDRFTPVLPWAKEGEKSPQLQATNNELRRIYAYLQALEGRLGDILLRADVHAPGLQLDATGLPGGSGSLKVMGGGLALFTATSIGWSRGARIYASAPQGVPDTTLTTLTWDSERFDPDGMHNTVNPTRITFYTPGTWMVGISASFTANATGFRALTFSHVSGSTTTFIDSVAHGNAGAAVDTRLNASTIWPMKVGDYVEAIALQNSGGPLNILSSPAFTPEFWAWQVG